MEKNPTMWRKIENKVIQSEEFNMKLNSSRCITWFYNFSPHYIYVGRLNRVVSLVTVFKELSNVTSPFWS